MTASEEKIVTISISEKDANFLYGQSTENFCAEQVGRFEVLGFSATDKSPLHPDFTGGTLYWCETYLAALIIREFENASGYEVNLLGDLAVDGDYVVESTRAWAGEQIDTDQVRDLSSFVEVAE